MAFFPFNRKKKQAKGVPRINASVEKSQLNLELEAVNRKQREIHDKAEATRKKIENIPKLIEQRKRREQQIIKDRARKSKSLRGLDKQPYKLPSVVKTLKMSRREQRSMATKFLILIAVLGALLLLLWRSVP